MVLMTGDHEVPHLAEMDFATAFNVNALLRGASRPARVRPFSPKKGRKDAQAKAHAPVSTSEVAVAQDPASKLRRGYELAANFKRSFLEAGGSQATADRLEQEWVELYRGQARDARGAWVNHLRSLGAQLVGGAAEVTAPSVSEATRDLGLAFIARGLHYGLQDKDWVLTSNELVATTREVMKAARQVDDAIFARQSASHKDGWVMLLEAQSLLVLDLSLLQVIDADKRQNFVALESAIRSGIATSQRVFDELREALEECAADAEMGNGVSAPIKLAADFAGELRVWFSNSLQQFEAIPISEWPRPVKNVARANRATETGAVGVNDVWIQAWESEEEHPSGIDPYDGDLPNE